MWFSSPQTPRNYSLVTQSRLIPSLKIGYPRYSQFQWIILTSLWTNGTVDIHHWQSQPQQRPARNRSAFAHRGQKVVLNSKKTQACARWSWTQALCVITLQTRIPLSHRLHLLSMDPNFGDHGIYIYIYCIYGLHTRQISRPVLAWTKKHAVRLTRVLFQHVSIISANREHQVGIPVYPIQSCNNLLIPTGHPFSGWEFFLLNAATRECWATPLWSVQASCWPENGDLPPHCGHFYWETEVLNLDLGLLCFQTNPGGNEETRANTTIQKNCKECWLILVKVLRGLPGTAMLTKKFGLKKQKLGKSTNFDCNPRVRNPSWNWGPKQLPPPDDPWFLPEVLSLLATQQQWQWINTQVQHTGTLLLTPYGCLLWIFTLRQLPNMLQ